MENTKMQVKTNVNYLYHPEHGFAVKRRISIDAKNWKQPLKKEDILRKKRFN